MCSMKLSSQAEYSKWWNSVLENRRKLRKSRVAHVENRISLADQIRLQRQALIQDKVMYIYIYIIVFLLVGNVVLKWLKKGINYILN